MNLVLIGGGTGLSNLLTGLRDDYRKKIKDLTAVVTTMDSGGSSGILKKIYDIPAIGDIRNCLIALSRIENYTKKVMQYRFSKGKGLSGHPLGNLFLLALVESEGNFLKAIEKANKILNVQGKVMPSTLEKVDLIAKFSDGKIIQGEAKITEYGAKTKKRIAKLSIKPKNPKVPYEVTEKIRKADMIIFGPGSLFTSILPNLLVGEIKEEVLKSKAVKVLIVNLLTEPGETDNFKASDHYYQFFKFSGLNKISALVVNKQKPTPRLSKLLLEERKSFVEPDIQNIKGEVKIYLGNFVNQKDVYFKHHPLKLKKVIYKIAKDFDII